MTQDVGPSAGSSLRSKIGSVAAASAVALVVVQLVSLGQTIALARLLSPAEVGFFVAGSALSMFFGNFVEGGLRAGLVTRPVDDHDAAKTVFWGTIAVGLLMAVAIVATAPVIALVFDSQTAGLVSASMSGIVLLYALTNVPEATLQRDFSVRRRLIVGPSVSISFAGVSVTLATFGWGVWSMVIASYVSYAVWVVTVWLICDWSPRRGRASLRVWRELVSYGFPLALGILGDRVREMAQAVVTGGWLGPSSLGFFRYGERIARIPVIALVEVSSIALFPAFTRMANDRTRLKAAYLRSLGLVTMSAAAISAMMIAVGEPLVVIVLGEKWREAGMVVVAMAGLGLGKAFVTVGEEAIKGASRTRLLNWYTFAEVSLSLVSMVLLIKVLGLVGLGLSVSVTALVVAVVVTALAKPVVGVSLRDIVGVTAPSIIAALVGLGVAAPLEHLVLHSDTYGVLAGLGLLTVDGLVFLGVYVALLWVIAPARINDVGQVVIGLVKRRKARGTSS